MSREQVMNSIGFGLVGICFIFALFQVGGSMLREADPNAKVIRFGHWQLEGGLEKAFDVLAEEYMKEHPDVTVVQMRIPERIYVPWLTTQLVGGTAPDLVQLGIGMTDDKLARFFIPLTEEVQKPNPYNKGTELEGVVWRSTFVDGLVGQQTLNPRLLEYYGIPNTLFTTRLYYNVELYKKATGREKPPETFTEFVKVCEEIKAYGKKQKEPLLPIAGSKYNAPPLIGKILSNQTANLMLEFDVSGKGRSEITDVMIGYLQGKWDLDHPAVTNGFELQRKLGKFMQAGFMQLGREDATFIFLQERAVLIASGSWDASSLIDQAPFEVRAFRIPVPAPGDGDHGKYARGALSEAATSTQGTFGVFQGSKNPELALDFLRFITSKRMNQKFVEHSRWLPAIVGVSPAPGMEEFMPITDGFPGGIEITQYSAGPESHRALSTSMHSLMSANGSVEKFKANMKRKLGEAFRMDLEKKKKILLQNASRFDTSVAALDMMAREGIDAEKSRRKVERFSESQIGQERGAYLIDYQLKKVEAK